MRPFLTTPDIIDSYLDAGYWSRETMTDRFRAHAEACPDRIACSDSETTYSWAELDATTDRLAANLIDLGLERDATALIQIPSSCREILLRVALKKAGVIGIFTPLQWRRRELAYVWERIDPGLVVMSSAAIELDIRDWLDDAIAGAGGRQRHQRRSVDPEVPGRAEVGVEARGPAGPGRAPGGDERRNEERQRQLLHDELQD